LLRDTVEAVEAAQPLRLLQLVQPLFEALWRAYGFRGDGNIQVNDRMYATDHHVPSRIAPNPLNPHRYVVLNSGVTFREYDYLNNARQVAKLPDWAIIDVRTPRNGRYPGKIVEAAFFG